jgi:glycosyltransferase involved in cell wall biosynthesis
MAPFAHYLRLWDYSSAARVDHFVANSRNVQHRIRRAYRRSSQIIHPPVAVEGFYYGDPDDYYLIVSELVAYKRIADAVRCFAKSGRILKIVGDGPEYTSLRKLAKANIKFCGRVSEWELADLYSRCRAVLLPGEEDFGIVAVEALASGKAVIALGRGGVLESVPHSEPRAGFFYPEPGETYLANAIEEFERLEPYLSPASIREFSLRFSERAFSARFSKLLLTDKRPISTSKGAGT